MSVNVNDEFVHKNFYDDVNFNVEFLGCTMAFLACNEVVFTSTFLETLFNILTNVIC